MWTACWTRIWWRNNRICPLFLLTAPQKPDKIWNTYGTCAEKDEYPPPRREESRRLVKGGREGAANITLELRAEHQ